jgi:archaellin
MFVFVIVAAVAAAVAFGRHIEGLANWKASAYILVV